MVPGAAENPEAPLLATSGLGKSFRGLRALKDHRIDVRSGEIVGVIGPNGAGKSTFFNLVTGFIRPSAGTVAFAGKTIHTLKPPAIARLGIARTFQGTRLFAQLTAIENLRAAAQLRRGPSTSPTSSSARRACGAPIAPSRRRPAS
jgi:branched-chain amino acid transport system ATP-binding protein